MYFQNLKKKNKTKNSKNDNIQYTIVKVFKLSEIGC